MSKPDQPEYIWFQKAAEKIIREGKNFLLVLDELKIDGFKPAEADLVYRSKTFQRILRQERIKFANEIASDPLLSKNTAIGMMFYAVQKLLEDEQWDKALEGLKKLSQLTGWQGTENNVNVFTQLTGKDIEAIKAEMQGKLKKGVDATAN